MPSESPNIEESLQTRLDGLLSNRQFPKTICPSEVPRSLTAADLQRLGVADWRDLMPTVRSMLEGMRKSGQVEILQKGEVVAGDVDVDDLRGPIRARKTES